MRGNLHCCLVLWLGVWETRWLVAFQYDTLLMCGKGEGKVVQARLLLIAVQLVVEIVLLN